VLKEFVHYGCTSEDINNIAYASAVSQARTAILKPTMDLVVSNVQELSHRFADVPMLARTHGQPATPTTVGKELAVFT
jgi:adenylosuccinate lyase